MSWGCGLESYSEVKILDSSDLVINQWLERQISIHEVMGSSPRDWGGGRIAWGHPEYDV